ASWDRSFIRPSVKTRFKFPERGSHSLIVPCWEPQSTEREARALPSDDQARLSTGPILLGGSSRVAVGRLVGVLESVRVPSSLPVAGSSSLTVALVPRPRAIVLPSGDHASPVKSRVMRLLLKRPVVA